ncbi:MAG: hypothetical protein ACLGHO_06045 [Gammaproteobacteria bacterium]
MDAGCLVTPNDASTAVPAAVPLDLYCQHAIAVARTTVDGLEAIEFEFEALAG